MALVKGVRKLNEYQIKTIANLLLEIGKWLLLSVVFSSFFAQGTKLIGPKEIAIALVIAFTIIIIAIWMLKGVKKDE